MRRLLKFLFGQRSRSDSGFAGVDAMIAANGFDPDHWYTGPNR